MEKAIFLANFLRCTFEIENGNISPLRVAILLQANQIATNFNLQEFSLWLQIFRIGHGFRLYPEYQDVHGEYHRHSLHASAEPLNFRQGRHHRKTKSEPPIKPAFYPKPLIEFCLNTKIYGITFCMEASESCAVVSLSSLHVNHHKARGLKSSNMFVLITRVVQARKGNVERG